MLASNRSLLEQMTAVGGKASLIPFPPSLQLRYIRRSSPWHDARRSRPLALRRPAFPRHAKNDEHEKSSRSGVDLNHLAETGGMAQGAESLESIRSMISLLHDDPRQDGEGCPVDM